MFTSSEIRHYSDLLQRLNEEKGIPDDYQYVLKGGGKDCVSYFNLLSNTKKGIYVIWVRGTRFTKFNDIGINIKTTAIPFYQGRCHKGYLHSAIEVLKLIQPQLINNHKSINKIVCLGHSMGGAVSSIICTILNKGDIEPLQNIAQIQQIYQEGGIRALIFGTPPTFSVSVSNETRNYITSIVSRNDVVPKLGNKFDSLAIYQRLLVTELMIEMNALGPNASRYVSSYLNEKLQNLRANRIPGRVVVIDIEEQTFSLSGNQREIQKISEFKLISEHCFVNYAKAINKMIVDSDDIFLIDKINKKISFNNLINQKMNDKFSSLYQRVGNELEHFSQNRTTEKKMQIWHSVLTFL